jgi:GNAT superfamily N-acetyltransferase
MTALVHRDAILADLPIVIAMLADGQIGGRADNPTEPLDPAYLAAFEAIVLDPNQRLIVAELDGGVVGTMLLSCLPGLLNRGAWRGQIDGVRIATDKRSLGLGSAMIGWAVEYFRARGCYAAQLTSNNDRAAAHRFYERLGWKKSHSGFKLKLTEGD